MRIACRTLSAAILGVLLSIGNAGAADLVGVYQVSWGGFPAGSIWLRLSQDSATYNDEIAIRSQGLPYWFTKFRGVGKGEGRLAENGAALPARYDAVYDLRKRRASHISMRFVDRDGGTVADRGPTDTSRKGPLAETYRRDVVDPIAALASIRHRLLVEAPRTGDKFIVPVYDGARRFDVGVEVAAAGSESVIRLHVTLKPIAGFKDEGDEENPGTADRPVEATFSNDGRLMPLSLRTPIFYLPLIVEFRHACKSLDTCAGEAQQ